MAALRMQAQGEALGRTQQQQAAQMRMDHARAQQWQAAEQQALRAQLSAQAQEDALQMRNALREIQVFGRVVSARTAQVLGVPVGTRSYASAQAMQKQAGGVRKSRKSGKKGASRQGEAPNGRLTAASELTVKYGGGRYS